jgi:hypothetical protein
MSLTLRDQTQMLAGAIGFQGHLGCGGASLSGGGVMAP